MIVTWKHSVCLYNVPEERLMKYSVGDKAWTFSNPEGCEPPWLAEIVDVTGGSYVLMRNDGENRWRSWHDIGYDDDLYDDFDDCVDAYLLALAKEIQEAVRLTSYLIRQKDHWKAHRCEPIPAIAY